MGGRDRPGSPQEGAIPLLGARIPWEILVDRSPAALWFDQSLSVEFHPSILPDSD